jgi:hypothetical protein
MRKELTMVGKNARLFAYFATARDNNCFGSTLNDSLGLRVSPNLVVQAGLCRIMADCATCRTTMAAVAHIHANHKTALTRTIKEKVLRRDTIPLR